MASRSVSRAEQTTRLGVDVKARVLLRSALPISICVCDWLCKEGKKKGSTGKIDVTMAYLTEGNVIMGVLDGMWEGYSEGTWLWCRYRDMEGNCL